MVLVFYFYFYFEQLEQLMNSKKYVNDICYAIIGSAIEVHRHLGPGLLESIYHQCLYNEIISNGLKVISQVHVPLFYKGDKLQSQLKMDLLIEDTVIVELKAVENIHPVYKAQLLSYLKLAEKPKGLLINFHCENISKSVIPIVTSHFSILPET